MPFQRRFALVVAVLACSSPLAVAPAAADITGPVIAHAPVPTAAYGQPIDLTFTATCPATAACAARFYYRTTAPAAQTAIPGLVNEGGFTVGSVNGTPTTTGSGQDAIEWKGQIPGSAVTTLGVDYFLEVEQNGARTVFPGTATADTVQPTGTYLHVQVVNPPLLSHEPVPVGIADKAHDVQGQVTCATGNCQAHLYYRKTPATLDPNVGWASTSMTATPGAQPVAGVTMLTISGQVPAGSVDTTGVDYYIHVTDGHTQAFSPGTVYQGYYVPRDGFRQPETFHHVHVLEPPRLVHEHVAAAPYRQDIPILAQTNCPVTRTCQGTLYYRTTPPETLTMAAFSSTSMTVARPVAGVEAVTVEGTIPAAAADTRGVDYYFSFSDGTTTSWWPGTSAVDGPGVWMDGTRVAYHHIRVLEPPHFVHAPTAIAEALTDLVIETELTCATEQCNVFLHYTSTPDTPNSSQTIQMNRTTATPQTPPTRLEIWQARIPASQVTTRGLAYYMTATDGYTNTAVPGTSYWGAYAPVDGSNPAPETARFVVRVVDPPHPVHAAAGVAYTGEPIPIHMYSNCATPSCPATLFWRITGQTTWQQASMDDSGPTPLAYGNDLRTYTGTIPGESVTTAGVEYRMEVSDGYVVQATPTYPVVVTGRPAAGTVGTALEFVPPAAQGAVDSYVPLSARTTWADGSPFNGTVHWCAASVTSASTGCLTSGTTTSTSGNVAFSVQPTTANPQLRVTAYADTMTAGVQDPTEIAGAAAVVGLSGPTAPEATTVTFVPPAAQVAQGTSATMAFTARRRDGSPFTGTVRWSAGTPGAPSYDNSTTTDSTGNGSVVASPTATTPVIEVAAYADSAAGGQFGTQDPTEVPGVATVVGTSPLPSVAQVTTLAFVPPVAQTAQDSPTTLAFTARRGDGTPFAGPVRWSAGAPGAPSFTNLASADSAGNGSVTVTPTASTPVVQVAAFADSSVSGVQDPGEVLGAAAAVGVPGATVPTGTTLVFAPPVAQTPQGASSTLSFTARNLDGSPFVGTVRWGAGLAGSVPAYGSTTSTNAAGTGTITVTPTATTPAVQVVAYADRSGTGYGAQDATEAPGAAAVVGTAAPTAPSATVLTFVPPVVETAQGTPVTVPFTARKGDGSPFVGTVRWGAAPAGSIPTFGLTTSTSSSGDGSVTVTPTTNLVQVVAYADGSVAGVQEPGELTGAAAVVGVGSLSVGTTVAFVPPLAQTPQGSSVTMGFKALNLDGSPFTGTVRWGWGAAGTLPSFPSSTSTDGSGNGSVTVTPTAATPTLEVWAYADRAGLGFGVQNQNEAMGTGAALGTPPTPTVPRVTTIAFVPPAAQTPQGSSVTMGFTARKGDGSPFTGTVRWGSGAPGSLPSFASTTSTSSSGNGTVTVTPTSTTPVVEITAYADDANSGTQDPAEVMGAAVVVGTDIDTDTPPSGTAVAFVPPVVQAVQGTPVSLAFTAKNHDGSPFVGTVRWGAGAAGSSPSFGGIVTTNSSGGGRITVADPDLATQVVAYADRSGANFGAQGATEATAAAAVVGMQIVSPTVPSGTDVVFSTPVARGQTGSNITVPFTARNFDGSPFVGTVRWSAGPAGSAPSFGSVVTTDAIGNGWVTVTPTADTPALHIAAYADRPGAGAGGQDTSEATGSAAALGDSAPAAPPPGTAVVFTTPVWTVPTGSWPCMAFAARHTNGTVFRGTVRYSLATAGSNPSFTLTTTTDGSGNGCISIEATTVPKQIVAFADRSDIGTFGGPPEPTEISGATVVIGVHA